MTLQPHLHIGFFGKKLHSFHFFGAVGLIGGLTLAISLAWTAEITVWPLLICSVVGLAVLFGLTFAYKIITGREDLVYYQHEISILVCCWITLKLMGVPVLPYLDITLLGVGAFMAFGRWGCFSVGCCHGRPSKFGVVYSPEHGEAGFPKYYVGIRMFPIPLIESAWVFCTVAIGVYTIINGFPAGTALVVYTVIYGLARFFFEYFRGDPERPYWNGFSEAQWTTLALLTFSLWGALTGHLPFYTWHLWIVIILISFMLLYKSCDIIFPFNKNRLLNPHHIREIVKSIKQIRTINNSNFNNLNNPIKVVKTFLGIQISIGHCLSNEGKTLQHFTVSYMKNKTNRKVFHGRKVAYRMAKLLSNIDQHLCNYEIVEGSPGFYHIVFYEQSIQQNKFDSNYKNIIKLRV
jgi:hypothetical protein